MFGSNKKEAKSKTTDIQMLEDTISQLSEENASYKQTISAFPGVKQHYEAELARVSKLYQAQVDILKEQVTNKDKEVAIRVNAALQSIGANSFVPDEIPISVPDSNPLEVLAKFQSLTGTERNEYYNKHKAALDRALMLVTNSTTQV